MTFLTLTNPVTTLADSVATDTVTKPTLEVLKEIIPADTAAVDTLSKIVNVFSDMSMQDAISFVIKMVLDLSFRLVGAILIYFVAQWVIKRIVKLMVTVFERRNIDISLRGFLVSLIKISMNIIVIISIVGILGVNTSSFIALFASAGLAIGMALSGTLQNFAGGLMVLFIKPFKVGDFIEAQGYSGSVKEISLFNTLINTIDNKTIIIPNGGLSTGIINNYSKEPVRRVDWTFGIAYGDNYDVAKETITEMLNKDTRVIKNPDIFIALHSLGDSSVNIVVRAWVTSEEYWDLYFDINEKVYKTFPMVGLSIPFPQMDIHMSK